MVSDAAIEAVGGAIGSSISLAVTYPLAIVSTWQALEHRADSKQQAKLREVQDLYKRLPTPIRELLTYEQISGWQSMFAGLKPCLVATAISQGIYFYLYTALRQIVVNRKTGGGASGGSTKTHDVGVLGSVLVASLAGCGNAVLTNPVWVVCTQMQANQRRSDPAKRRQSASSIARQVFQEGGVAGFWKGVWPALVMVINPTLQYILYEWLTSRLLALRRQAAAAPKAGGRPAAPVALNITDVFLLSALAKLGATLVTYPMLLVKSRLQAMTKATAKAMQYTGLFDAVVRIFKSEGFLGFFKGMKLKMIQTVLAAALLMSIKEHIYKTTRRFLGAPEHR